jgi:hypothetical protein
MLLLDTPVNTASPFWDGFKLVAPYLTGGVAGTILTNVITNRRNRIQPVGKRVTVSSVDIPAIMPGYDSEFTLSDSVTGSKHHYAGISTVKLELINTGNKDITSFDVGINLPDGAIILGIQHKTPDRYHVITQTPAISITAPESYVDLVFKPFNRGENYSTTLIVSYTGGDLLNQVKLSTTQAIRFIDELAVHQLDIDVLSQFIESMSPIGGLISLSLSKALRQKLKEAKKSA